MRSIRGQPSIDIPKVLETVSHAAYNFENLDNEHEIITIMMSIWYGLAPLTAYVDDDIPYLFDSLARLRT